MAGCDDYKKTPLWNSALPMEKRLDHLLEQLTLEEKFQCLGTGCPKIERLGIEPFYVGGEGAHGVQARHDQSFDKGKPQPTTILPNPIGMSATWDVELMKRAGQVVGNEARAVFSKEKRGSLCLWAPTIDMERDPRWGRTEEAYGEDPYLTGKMASAYIQGLRGEDPFYLRCGATLKHFYANNVEEGRTWISSSVDPRNKHEYYLEPFRRAVVEGGAEGIMTAYNEVNGVPCILNDEVQKIAKEQWGLHHVVCDGGDMKQTVNCHRYFGSHSETIAAGLKAGIDCFTDDIEDVVAGAREAYERGMISITEINRALRNHFGTMIRLGLFDAVPKNPYAEIGTEELNTKENQRVSYELAKESVVLLKNEKLLPLYNEKRNETSGLSLQENPDGNLPEELAVVGPLADVWYKDWYSGIPPYQVTPLEGIRKYQKNAGFESGIPQIKLAYKNSFLGLLEDGRTIGLVPEERAEIFEITLWDKHQATLRSMSTGLLLTTEDGRDEEDNLREGIVTASKSEAFGWFVKEAFQVEYEGESFQSVLAEGRELQIRSWNRQEYFIDETGRLRVPVDGNVPVKDASAADRYKAGEQGCGMEPEGFSQRKAVTFRTVLVKDSLQDAVHLAEKSDIVVLVAGGNPVINCKEERDRHDIDLPLYQHELVQAVYAANPKVVLALISNVPFAVNWEQEHIPSIVMMASGSMELGNALADVLFGKAAPAGRLNMTWYRDIGQLPEINDYDIIQKERTYQYFRGDVLYPFGHGLTYEPVEYSNLQVTLRDRTVLEISLEVCNAGKSVTDEVVQIYVAKYQSQVKRALHQLKGFVRVKDLQPGEFRCVSVEVPLADLRYYDVICQEMLLEPGEYEIQAGASSQDIRLRQKIFLKGTDRGCRDGMCVSPADHYDRSKNARLWEGHMGYCSVGTYCLEKPMELQYDRVSLTGTPSVLAVDAVMARGASVQVYLNDILVGTYNKKKEGQETELVLEEGWAAGVQSGVSQHPVGFSSIRIPVSVKDAFRISCLRLVCRGKIQICSWQFL